MTNQLNLIVLSLCLMLFSCKVNPPQANCNDNIQNGSETGVDCGGPDCIPCPSCNDFIKNGSETGIDCGGDCAPCHAVIPDNELLIRELSVVKDEVFSSGDLSFGKLLRRMAESDEDYKSVVLSLVNTWDQDHTINSFSVPARSTTSNQIKTQWKLNQGLQANLPDDQWSPDAAKAPFRLLAITNRIDLNQIPQKAGEGRLTFGQADNGGNDFTLIFEYKLPGSTEKDVIKWAKRWHQLSSLNLGSTEYLDTLTAIILDFTRSGLDLGQIRTNSVQGGPWEFRELVWNNTTKLLEETTRKQNPSTNQLNENILAGYLNDPINRSEILDGNHRIKETFNGNSILAGDTEYSSNFRWNVSGVDQNILNELDRISCTGCHGGLSSSSGIGFTHIKPRAQNSISQVSNFLRFRTDMFRKDSLESLLKLDLPITSSNLEVSHTREIQDLIELLKSMENTNTEH